jgi:uncharacterized protein with PQ loop repeat
LQPANILPHGPFWRANTSALGQETLMMITKNLGMLLLAIYLILVGITLLFHITIPTIVMGILALAAGILILIGR